MSPAQHSAVHLQLRSLYEQGYRFVRHGDCVGADAQFDSMARNVGYSVIMHPPSNSYKRAFCNRRGPTEVLPTKGFIERNHDIVDASSVMIATPKEKDEQLRSGTWATIRYSRKKRVTLTVVYP